MLSGRLSAYKPETVSGEERSGFYWLLMSGGALLCAPTRPAYDPAVRRVYRRTMFLDCRPFRALRESTINRALCARLS